jgi:hypothetical protein
MAFPILLMNYFRIFCNTYFTDKQATMFTPAATATMIVASLGFAKIMDYVSLTVYVFIHVVLQIVSVGILWKWMENLWLFYTAYVIIYSLYSSSTILFYTATSKVYGIEISLKLFWIIGWTNAVSMGVISGGQLVLELVGFDMGYLIISIIVGVNFILAASLGFGE